MCVSNCVSGPATAHDDTKKGAPVHRPAAHHARTLYAISATCAVIGALLWVRDRTSEPPRVYSNFLAADGYTGTTWRVWSQAVPEERLGLYLLAVGLVLALVACFLPARRE